MDTTEWVKTQVPFTVRVIRDDGSDTYGTITGSHLAFAMCRCDTGEQVEVSWNTVSRCLLHDIALRL